MKNLSLIFSFIISITACATPQLGDKLSINTSSKVTRSELQLILDAAKVEGVILIYDKQTDTYYSNDFQESLTGVLPASTFKIPHSIIGLELGLLQDEQTVFKWDGKSRRFSIWEKDLSLKAAFQNSCVPCYQSLAKRIGTQKMAAYVSKLKFGEMDINEANIDSFWLAGQSKISPLQQIDFLMRLYEGRLPIAETTRETVKAIMKAGKLNNRHVLSAKTGLAVSDGEQDIGWFVGYVEKTGNPLYFATKISPIDNQMESRSFAPLRKKITLEALAKLHLA